MLGFYEGFPPTVHKAMHFTTPNSNRSLQKKLTESLHGLNTQTLNLEKVTDPSIRECHANFEFGIAEADGFNYLDDDETARVLKAIGKKPLQTMDLFCVVRYSTSRGERKTSLRSDYCMIRFTFGRGLMDAYVFHEKGSRYTSAEDIINAIVNEVNAASLKKTLKEVL